MPTLLWIIAGVLTLLGGAGLWLGLRGRRVNDHPICRKCKFDLVGVYAPSRSTGSSVVAQLSELCAERPKTGAAEPPPSALKSTPSAVPDDAAPVQGTMHSSERCATTPRCPECGRELTARRAVRFGARRKRPAFLAGAVLLLLIAASIGGAWGWGRANSFNWNSIKPVWMLRMEAEGSDDGAADAALTELLARARQGELSDSAARALTRRALTIHADSEQPWRRLWGNLIEWAHQSHLVTDEEFERYVQQAVLVWFADEKSSIPQDYAWALDRHRQQPKYEGERIFLTFSFGNRGAAASDLFVRPVLEKLVVDGQIVPSTPSMHHHAGLAGGGFGNINVELVEPIAAGTHEVVATWRMHVFRDSRVHPNSWSRATTARDHESGELIELPLEWRQLESTPIADFELTVRGRFTIEPARHPHAVHLLRDPELKALVEDAISIRFSEVRREGDHLHFALSRSVKPLPFAIAFDVFVLDGGREWSSAPLHVEANEELKRRTMRIIAEVDEFDLRSDRVDVILRPNPKAVELEDGFEAIWGDEIILRDVPVEWVEPR